MPITHVHVYVPWYHMVLEYTCIMVVPRNVPMARGKTDLVCRCLASRCCDGGRSWSCRKFVAFESILQEPILVAVFEERQQAKAFLRVSCHASFVRVPLRLSRPGDTRCANTNPDTGASSSHQAWCGGYSPQGCGLLAQMV